MTSTEISGKTGRGWPWFAAWTLVGALVALGLLALLSVGPLALLAAGVLAGLLLRAPRTHQGWPGILCGPAILSLVVAYLNRQGPGDVCRSDANGGSCVQQWSPWPWLAVGLVLLAASVVIFVLVSRRSEQAV